MDSGNPYEPPREPGQVSVLKSRSLWFGPLLTISSLAFFFAAVAASVSVIPEQLPSQYKLIAVLLVIGFVFLGLSFHLHRRGGVSKSDIGHGRH